MKKKAFSLLGLAAVGLLLAGCTTSSPEPAPAPAPDSEASEATTDFGEGTEFVKLELDKNVEVTYSVVINGEERNTIADVKLSEIAELTPEEQASIEAEYEETGGLNPQGLPFYKLIFTHTYVSGDNAEGFNPTSNFVSTPMNTYAPVSHSVHVDGCPVGTLDANFFGGETQELCLVVTSDKKPEAGGFVEITAKDRMPSIEIVSE